MKRREMLKTAAVAGILAVGMTAASGTVMAKPDMEKCGGVVKAGMNDCGSANHACAGQSTQDGAADEWVYVPEGTCNKLVGGTLLSKKD